MQPQPKAAIRTARVSRLTARRELRANVIYWREQAMEQRIRTLPLPPAPPAPGEGGEPEVVRPWVQNLVIGLVAGAAIVLAIASGAGAL